MDLCAQPLACVAAAGNERTEKQVGDVPSIYGGGENPGGATAARFDENTIETVWGNIDILRPIDRGSVPELVVPREPIRMSQSVRCIPIH